MPKKNTRKNIWKCKVIREDDTLLLSRFQGRRNLKSILEKQCVFQVGNEWFYPYVPDFFLNWPLGANRRKEEAESLNSDIPYHIQTESPSCFLLPGFDDDRNMEFKDFKKNNKSRTLLLLVDKDSANHKIMSPLSVVSIDSNRRRKLTDSSEDSDYYFPDIDKILESTPSLKEKESFSSELFGHVPGIKHKVSHVNKSENSCSFFVTTAISEKISEFEREKNFSFGVPVKAENFPSYLELWKGEDLILAYILSVLASSGCMDKNKDLFSLTSEKTFSFLKEVSDYAGADVWNKTPSIRLYAEEKQPFSLSALFILYAYAGMKDIEFKCFKSFQEVLSNKTTISSSLLDRKNENIKTLLDGHRGYEETKKAVVKFFEVFKPDIGKPVYNKNYLGDNEDLFRLHGRETLFSLTCNLFPDITGDLLEIYKNSIDFSNELHTRRLFSSVKLFLKDFMSPHDSALEEFFPLKSLVSLHKSKIILEHILSFFKKQKKVSNHSGEIEPETSKQLHLSMMKILEFSKLEHSPQLMERKDFSGVGLRVSDFNFPLITDVALYLEKTKEQTGQTVKRGFPQKWIETIDYYFSDHFLSRQKRIDENSSSEKMYLKFSPVELGMMCGDSFLDTPSLLNDVANLFIELAITSDKKELDLMFGFLKTAGEFDWLNDFAEKTDIIKLSEQKSKKAAELSFEDDLCKPAIEDSLIYNII